MAETDSIAGILGSAEQRSPAEGAGKKYPARSYVALYTVNEHGGEGVHRWPGLQVGDETEAEAVRALTGRSRPTEQAQVLLMLRKLMAEGQVAIVNLSTHKAVALSKKEIAAAAKAEPEAEE